MRIATSPAPDTTLTCLPNAPKATRIALLVVATFFSLVASCEVEDSTLVDGDRALRLVAEQVAFGPRIPGTEASVHALDWIEESLAAQDWETSVESAVYRGVQLRNLVGRRGSSAAGPIIIGTHYDTRPSADQDALAPHAPVPGANDGASGVAVLLELARVLPPDMDDLEVWLAFFDGEDSGDLNGWDWSAGAETFASGLQVTPQAVVIVDMVGDADLRLPRERSSDTALADEIWGIAGDLGADAFVDEPGVAILDDHRPFLARGVPAVLIIDLQYDYWHTTEDTLNKVSAGSLEQVATVLQAWILSRR
jgi:glutaminyl-peptide cyclotransferase